MKAFPPELADLLGASGRAFLSGRRRAPSMAIRRDVIPRGIARACTVLLDRHLYPLLGRSKIPRVRTATIRGAGARPRAVRAAGLIGLGTLLDSPSLRRFAEKVTGLRLGGDRGQQVICYERGGYPGDHAEHADRPAYVEVQLMFSKRGIASGIAVHRLPLRHRGRPPRAYRARRWVVLASFEILRSRARTSPAPLFEVRRSGIHGRGVFAIRRIPKDTRILEYVGERIDDDEAAARYDDDARERHHTFLFSVAPNVSIDAAVGGNASRFINHACEPNCIAYVEDGRVFIETLGDVRAGAELTYDYRLSRSERRRASWRTLYACACGSRRCRGVMLDGPPRG